MRIGHSTSRLAIACALAVASWTVPAVAKEQSRRPNILVIIADDVGLDEATGMYPGLIERMTRAYGPDGRNDPNYGRIAGHPASTPVLDHFAQQGMVFTQAWAHPFCSPTRAGILTGLYAKNTGVATYADPLTQAHHSFVSDLRAAGYLMDSGRRRKNVGTEDESIVWTITDAGRQALDNLDAGGAH